MGSDIYEMIMIEWISQFHDTSKTFVNSKQHNGALRAASDEMEDLSNTALTPAGHGHIAAVSARLKTRANKVIQPHFLSSKGCVITKCMSTKRKVFTTAVHTRGFGHNVPGAHYLCMANSHFEQYFCGNMKGRSTT